MLLDLIMDPFEDVREVSSNILSTLINIEMECRTSLPNNNNNCKDEFVPNVVGRLLNAIGRAKTLSQSTGRACHAEGLGRLLSLSYGTPRCPSPNYDRYWLYQLLEADLEQDVHAAASSLPKAVRSSPLLGNLIAIR